MYPHPFLASLSPKLPTSLTTPVFKESLAKHSSVIIAYHPAIFKGLQSFTLSNPLQSSLLQCAASGISVYSPHTALDSVWGGINDWLAEGLMKSEDDGEIRSLVREKVNVNTGESEGGEGRLLTFKEPIGMDILEQRIKSHLKLSQSLCPYFVFSLPLTALFISSSGRISLWPAIFYTFNRHLRWLRWLNACWPGCRPIPHGRNVACQNVSNSKIITHIGL